MKTRKRFGQHFLRDEETITKIIRAIEPSAADVVMEIGPGDGALTAALSRASAKLLCVEIDRDLAEKLGRRFSQKISSKKMQLIVGDVLSENLSALFAAAAPQKRVRIVGNLPYNISAPLLQKLAATADDICDMHLMLQKEVAQRICAATGDSDYGRLSVFMQTIFCPRLLFCVAPKSFFPPPKVESAMVRLTPKTPPLQTPAIFPKLVRAAFQSRRKTLENGLKEFDINWQATTIDKKNRPQNLSPQAFISLAKHIADKK